MCGATAVLREATFWQREARLPLAHTFWSETSLSWKPLTGLLSCAGKSHGRYVFVPSTPSHAVPATTADLLTPYDWQLLGTETPLACGAPELCAAMGLISKRLLTSSA